MNVIQQIWHNMNAEQRIKELRELSTDIGKKKYPPDGINKLELEDNKDCMAWEACTCKSECPEYGCKGECGCKACHANYMDFLSSYGE